MIITETCYWLEQAEHHAEEASKYFRCIRPRSGADEMAVSAAILQSALPLVGYAGRLDLVKAAIDWINSAAACLAKQDWVTIVDVLKYERGFIAQIREAIQQNPSDILTLDAMRQDRENSPAPSAGAPS